MADSDRRAFHKFPSIFLDLMATGDVFFSDDCEFLGCELFRICVFWKLRLRLTVHLVYTRMLCLFHLIFACLYVVFGAKSLSAGFKFVTFSNGISVSV